MRFSLILFFLSLISISNVNAGIPYISIFLSHRMFPDGHQYNTLIHEFIHSQGGSYKCGKRTIGGEGNHSRHMNTANDIMGKGELKTGGPELINSKNDTYYRHGIEGCPDLADSVFLEPTSDNPCVPFDIICKGKPHNFTHKKFSATNCKL